MIKLGQMRRHERIADAKLTRDFAGGQSIAPRANQEFDGFEPCLLRERGKMGEGSCHFHNSINIEMIHICQDPTQSLSRQAVSRTGHEENFCDLAQLGVLRTCNRGAAGHLGSSFDNARLGVDLRQESP